VGILWARLGTRDAISWFSVGFVVALQTSGSLISSLTDFDGRFVHFIIIRLLSLAVLSAVLGLGWLALRYFARTKPQPVITLTTFALAVSAGTFVFDVLLVLDGFAEDYRFLSRLVTAFIGVVVGLTLVALLVASAREHGRANAQLIATAEELVSLRTEAEGRIVQRHQELVQSIRQQITAQLAQVRGSSLSDASVMRSLIDDVVRPLSYSLAKESTPAATPSAPSLPSGVAWSGVLTRALGVNPVHPRSFAVGLGAIGVAFLTSNFGLRGLLATVAIVATTFAVSALSWWLWSKLPGALPMPARVVGFSVLGVVLALGTAWVGQQISGFVFFEPVRIVAWAGIVALATWAISLAFAVFDLLRQTNDQLRATVADLRREVAAVNTSLRQLHKSVSRILHGPIQEAITSVLMKLESHPELATAPGFPDQVRTRIENALTLLTAPDTGHSDPGTIVANLQELWGEVVDISMEVSESDLVAIRSHQRTAYAVAEIVREACHNAIRHADATSITIAMKVSTRQRLVTITVSNVGIPIAHDAALGLGTQLLEDLTLEWKRAATPHGTRMTATLPLIP
jgi:hypothetical protein